MNQECSYQGLSEESTLILPCFTYIGMSAVFFLPDHFFSDISSNKTKRAKKEDEEDPNGVAPHDDPEITGVKTMSPLNNNLHRTNRAQSDPFGGEAQPLVAATPKSTAIGSIDSKPVPLPPFCLKLGPRGILGLMILADFGGTSASLAGMQLCGSGLHTVVMSSTVCWAAALSYLILNKKPKAMEVLSLVMIMLGLVFSAIAQKHMGVVQAAEDVHGIDPLAPKPGERLPE